MKAGSIRSAPKRLRPRRRASFVVSKWSCLSPSQSCIPVDGHQPISGPVLLDEADRRECEMEADDQRLFRRRHVVEFVTRLLRLFRFDVEARMPIGMAQEQLGNIGDVGLDEYPRRTG